MNYLTTIPNMNSTPELPIEALIEEAYEDFTQHSQSQRVADRSQRSLEPEWYPIIKPCKEKASDTDIIVARDINSDGSKNFAIFSTHQSILDYSDSLKKEHRVLYEWLTPHLPAKLVFDIDSSNPRDINSPIYQRMFINSIVMDTVKIFQQIYASKYQILHVMIN